MTGRHFPPLHRPAVALVLAATFAIAQDATPPKIYWTDNEGGTISRANLDGTGEETVIDNAPFPLYLWVDQEGRKVYWSELEGLDNINRAELDGTDIDFLVSRSEGTAGFAADLEGGTLYWANAMERTIRAGNIDGTERKILVDGLDAATPIDPTGLALDKEGGKLYWGNPALGVTRANLDGSGFEVVVPSSGVTLDVALDLTNGKLYFCDRFFGAGFPPRVVRANLDGSEVETLLAPPDIEDSFGLALDTDAGHLYVTETFAGRILRLDLQDGSLVPVIAGRSAAFIALYQGDDGNEEPPSTSFVRGDCDGDGQVAGVVTDAVFLLTYLFLEGSAPSCLAACDVDADGTVAASVTDAVGLLSYNFLSGPAPVAPFPDCGPGTEADVALGCDTPTAGCEQTAAH